MTRLDKETLKRKHDRAAFDCGVEDLNHFVKTIARKQDERQLARTTVLVDPDKPEKILAYYSTAPCECLPPENEARWKNDPHPVPFLRMARLAVDQRHQRQRLGERALFSAIADAVHIHNNATVLGGLIVDAKDEKAAQLYEQYGFLRFEEGGLTLYLPIDTCIAAIEDQA